jgi:hypothetical protein
MILQQATSNDDDTTSTTATIQVKTTVVTPTTMVRFDDTVTIHVLEKYDATDGSDDDESTSLCWTPDEETEISFDDSCPQRVQSSSPFFSKQKGTVVVHGSSRGLLLERFLPGVDAERRIRMQSQAQKAILMAQAMQQKHGIRDPQCLAQIYTPYSRKCMEWATCRAVLDEQSVYDNESTRIIVVVPEKKEKEEEEQQQQPPLQQASVPQQQQQQQQQPPVVPQQEGKGGHSSSSSFSYSDKYLERLHRSKARRMLRKNKLVVAYAAAA